MKLARENQTGQETVLELNKELVLKAKIRLLRMHYEAGVGHIGGNLSCIDAILLLFHEFLRPNDNFILSKGHSAGALYIALWSIGVIQDSELSTFHQDDTRLAGHPPFNLLREISFGTGSLGHGLSLASGTALARKLRGDQGHTFCLMSDGELQEGSTWEALIFAAHHRLCNLTILIDGNGLQGFGNTSEVASMTPIERRLKAFDVMLLNIDGHDIDAVRSAIQAPQEMISPRPKVIILKTTKGKGVSYMENKMEWHYLPLTKCQFYKAVADLEKSV